MKTTSLDRPNATTSATLTPARGSYPTHLGPGYAARINAAGTVVWGSVLVSDLSAGQSIAPT